MKKWSYKHLLHFNSFKDVYQPIIHHIKQTMISIMCIPYLFLQQTISNVVWIKKNLGDLKKMIGICLI